MVNAGSFAPAALKLFLPLLTLASTAACTINHMTRESRPEPVFDAVAFFDGYTTGRGMLKVMFHRSEPTLVSGNGHVAPDHSIILEQIVSRGHRAPTHRTWNLHPDDRGRYSGSLTDAAGPVSGRVEGNRLFLTFAMKGGLRAEQYLYLDTSGRIAHNVMTFRKLGMTVAQLDETITHETR